jgi:hypothetical protein
MDKAASFFGDKRERGNTRAVTEGVEATAQTAWALRASLTSIWKTLPQF